MGDFWGEAEWMAVMRALVYKNYIKLGIQV